MYWQSVILFLTIATLGLWGVVSVFSKEYQDPLGDKFASIAVDISPSSSIPATTPFTLRQAEYEALIDGLEYAALSYQLEDDPSRPVRVSDMGFSETQLETYALSPSTAILSINDQSPGTLFQQFRGDYFTQGTLKLELQSDTGPVTVAWRLEETAEQVP
jgi:hypothetical protein